MNEIRHNQEKQRFEMEAGSDLAFLNYRESPGKLTFIHTEVPKAMEGQGLGAALAKAGLDYARQSGMKVVPQCPFIASYIKRHPDYAGLTE